MKNNKAKLLAVAVALGVSAQANAAIELYNQGGTTFSADGHFNAFYTQTDDEASNEKQSRVRMGFLPNYIGFNVSKEINDLTVGGRSSFWVSINDGHGATATDTAIDVRQFYATVDGDFGQVLFGKDFGIYARTNIFNDELLLGTGLPSLDSTIVTLGNISVGYPYTQPRSQITYRTKDMGGFKLAAAILDPSSGQATNANGNNSVRFEAEATYGADFDGGKFSAWLSGASGEYDNGTTTTDESGAAYGARVSFGGFQLTASGFDQSNIDTTFAGTNATTDSDGYLVQASYSVGANRFVLSTGKTEIDNANNDEKEMDAVAWFYDINSNMKLVVEYDMTTTTTAGVSTDTDQLAIGATLSW